MSLDGHEQRIIHEPMAVFISKRIDLCFITLPAALFGKLEHIISVGIYLSVINASRIAAPIDGLDLILCDQTFLDQHVNVYQIWVPGKC